MKDQEDMPKATNKESMKKESIVEDMPKATNKESMKKESSVEDMPKATNEERMKGQEDMTKATSPEQAQAQEQAQEQESTLNSSKEATIHLTVLSRLQGFSRSQHKMKRLGRGRSSGHGGTSTKGHKGQRARSGFGLLRGFEGGQMPLVRLLPKFGFTNGRFKTRYDIINLSDLNRFESEVDPKMLYSAGLVRKKALVKILAKGQIKKSLTVRAHRFSKKATQLIEKAGGKTEVVKAFSIPSDSVTKESAEKNKPESNQSDGNINQ